MVILALDIAVIAIVAFCGWRGYRNGLLRGVFGIVSLVVSLFVASIAATAYSGDFKEMLSPFVGGVIDKALTDIMDEGSKSDLGGFDGKSDNYKTAYTALRRIGLPEPAAAHVAALATEGGKDGVTPETTLSDLISDKLSSTLAFVIVFGIAFLLLAIIFAVIGNLVGFIFSLPGLRIIDIITGIAFGLAKGLLIVYTLAAVVRYAGLLAPDTINGTTVLKYIINNNPIADIIGI